MEVLIATETASSLAPLLEAEREFDFFNPTNLENSIAVETFLTTALLRRLTQLLTYSEEQLEQAIFHITAIESLLGIA